MTRLVLLVSFVFLLGIALPVTHAEETDYITLPLAELTQKATAGDAKAQFYLAARYYQGEEVAQDYQQAVNWFRKAAEQGDAKSQFNIGVMYYHGRGVEQDFREALNWYQKAAELGDAPAQCATGNMYEEGKGVPQDIAQAASWWKKAAEQEFAPAQANMGERYYYGNRGVPQNFKEAANWFNKAAEQGFVPAYYHLALIYDKGQGTPRDLVLAYVFYSLAAAEGHMEAMDGYDEIVKEITPEQTEEGHTILNQLQSGEIMPTTSKTGRKGSR